MKQKNKCIVLTILLSILLTACGEPDGANFYEKGSDIIAEQRIQTIIEAVESENSDLIVDLFASEVIESDAEIKNEAAQMIEFIQNVDSYDYTGGKVSEMNENTTAPYQKYYYATFDITCADKEITLSLKEYVESTELARGVRSIYIISKNESDWRYDNEDTYGVPYHEGIMVDDTSLEEIWSSYESAMDKALTIDDLQIRCNDFNICLGEKFDYPIDPDELDFQEQNETTMAIQKFAKFTIVEEIADKISDWNKEGLENVNTEIIVASAVHSDNAKRHTNRGVFINDPRDKVILKYGEGQEEDNALIYCCEGEGYLKFLFDEQDNVSEIRIYRDVDLLQ